ncbi:cofilin [Amniculicola lignicola CBS 123094]|uniref:Cofilin n=1 Tax=Amniculicola lignicola CBS 123094 TaxID=1392246 RepID=A0A6A5WRA1_9PLEO|nr:cofilin [Amniculicola lignicola CBS 123094]
MVSAPILARSGGIAVLTDRLQAQSGVSVNPECISTFNDLKLGKSIKWIIYRISDDWKEIVVDETSEKDDYEEFRQKLLGAKSKDRRGKEGIGGRYAVYDVAYELESGEGTRNKITFISWTPDEASQYVSVDLFPASSGGRGGANRLARQPRMMYSTSKEAIKRALNGLASDIQANDADDIEYENIVSRVSKGR